MMVVANDVAGPPGPSCDWDMTVLELAMFMCVFRARRPPPIAEICEVVGGWFECDVDPMAASVGLSTMVAQRWLDEDASRFRATDKGCRIARPLMRGIINILDQGTKLLDVALMMSVLQLTRGELDYGPRDA